MSVVLNAADCVWVLARSDVNPQDGQVDRFEFNAVLLEILAGCRLINDATPRDVDYIFETAACYCLDYDDAACCNDDDVVIYRAGKYPSSYLLGVCEFLESAVAFQCNDFTSSPVTSIVIQPPSPAPAPSPPTLDLDVITQVVIPWIVVWTILLLVVILLLVAIICMMACWRRQQQLFPQQQQQQQYAGEYRDYPPRIPQEVAPAATTVARGTIDPGTENIHFAVGAGDRRRRRNRDMNRDVHVEDETDIEQDADRILSEMLATERAEDDDAIIGSEVSTTRRKDSPSTSSDTGIRAVDGTDNMVEHSVMKQSPPLNPSEAISSPAMPPPHSPSTLRQDADTTMSAPPSGTPEDDLLVSNDDLLNIVHHEAPAGEIAVPSPIPHIGDVVVTDDEEGEDAAANDLVRVFSFSTNMDSFATPRNDEDGALSTDDGSCGSIPKPDWDR